MYKLTIIAAFILNLVLNARCLPTSTGTLFDDLMATASEPNLRCKSLRSVILDPGQFPFLTECPSTIRKFNNNNLMCAVFENNFLRLCYYLKDGSIDTLLNPNTIKASSQINTTCNNLKTLQPFYKSFHAILPKISKYLNSCETVCKDTISEEVYPICAVSGIINYVYYQITRTVITAENSEHLQNTYIAIRTVEENVDNPMVNPKEDTQKIADKDKILGTKNGRQEISENIETQDKNSKKVSDQNKSKHPDGNENHENGKIENGKIENGNNENNPNGNDQDQNNEGNPQDGNHLDQKKPDKNQNQNKPVANHPIENPSVEKNNSVVKSPIENNSGVNNPIENNSLETNSNENKAIVKNNTIVTKNNNGKVIVPLPSDENTDTQQKPHVENVPKISPEIQETNLNAERDDDDNLMEDKFDFEDDFNENQDDKKSKISKSKPKELNEDILIPANVNTTGQIEDEDSFFFVYFMMVCAVFILGYIGYHNKQKVLALVIEGRRGRRGSRRSARPNSANYHKLDSNLEEAVTSSVHKNAANIIY